MQLAPGSRLGTYEVVSLIGKGGMGEVYLAQDPKLNRLVAIKVLPDAMAADPERLARLEREAKAIASLNHQNIGSIYGLEEANGTRALILEFVEGPTLAEAIGRGMPLDDALGIARQIADALESAHERGVIHRDLKPANIKIRHDGAVKVLDFGLAKVAEPAPGSGTNLSFTPTLSMQATMAGVILGTAAYMSPEQARGRAVNRRTDVWAFGCVLFEMLTGTPAFNGEDVAETIGAVIHKEPDWSRLGETTPVRVRLALQRCLEKDPRRRFRDIGDVQLALSGAFDAPAPAQLGASTPAPRWKRMVPAAIAALAAAAVAAGVTWRLRQVPHDSTVTRFTIVLSEGQRFSGTLSTVIGISPDGTQIAYLANDRIFVRPLSSFDARSIVGNAESQSARAPSLGLAAAGGLFAVVFSPDGHDIAYYSQVERAVRRIPAAGGAPVTLCGNLVLPSGLDWTPNGILVGQTEGIVNCSPNGGAQPLIAVQNSEQAASPHWLPGTDFVMFSLARNADGDARWDKAQIVVQNVKGGARKVLGTGNSPSYLPSGHLLYAREGVLFAAPFDLAKLTVTGSPISVVEGVQRGANSTIQAGLPSVHAAVSDTGTLVYIPGPTSTVAGYLTVAVADRSGTVKRLPIPAGAYEHVRVSSDGVHLTIGSDDGTEAIVWTFDMGGAGQLRRLTFGGRNRYPIWSPDGQRVAFQSNREGDLAIFVQRADGTGPVERLTKPDPGAAHIPESWSSNGALSFSSVAASVYSLHVVHVADKTVAPFAGVHSMEPINSTFSPDGRWIAYTSTPEAGAVRSPNRGVYVQPFPPTGAQYQVPHPLDELVFEPVWGAKGDELTYVPTAVSGRLLSLSVKTSPSVMFGPPAPIPAAVTGARGSGLTRAYDSLPDGRFIGVVREAELAGAPDQQIRVVVNWFEELRARGATK